MAGSEITVEEKQRRNRRERYRQIERWAAYVRTHPDEDWGRQVKTLIEGQLSFAQHQREAERSNDS